MGCFKRTASKHVYSLGWNRSPAQVGCMRQALGPGALGRPRGSGWRGRWEGGSGWGTHVNPWLFHFNVWQNSLQIKKKEKKRKMCQVFLDSMVWDERSTVILIGICFPINIEWFLFGWFKIFFPLSLVFRGLIMMYLGTYFFGFILFWIHSSFWICRFISSTKFGKFQLPLLQIPL